MIRFLSCCMFSYSTVLVCFVSLPVCVSLRYLCVSLPACIIPVCASACLSVFRSACLCVSLPVCIFIHVCVSLCLYVFFIHVCVPLCLYVFFIHVCVSLCMYVFIPVCVFLCLSVRLPGFSAACMCMSVCLYACRSLNVCLPLCSLLPSVKHIFCTRDVLVMHYGIKVHIWEYIYFCAYGCM